MAGVGLQIDPTELTFRFELRKIIPVTLSLHNPTNEKIAFKVKTTNPKKYCVRPSSGFVDPETTKDVQVIMQAQREYPSNLADCKDKFLVQWVNLQPHIQEITAETFDAAVNKDVRQARLRVNLIGPPKPPSPVPEGTEEEASPLRNNFQNAPQASTGATNFEDRSRLQQQIAKLEREKNDLSRRVQSYQSGPAKSSGQQLIKGSGFSFIHIVIAIVVAYSIGRFL